MAKKTNGVYLRTYPSGKTAWYIRFPWKGRDVHQVGGPTKEAAKRKLIRTLAGLQEGRLHISPAAQDTLAGAIERYRPLAQRKPRYKGTLMFFRYWLDRYGTTPLYQLTPSLIEQAQAELVGKKLSPITINHYTGWLRVVLNREVRDGTIPSNPVSRVKELREPSGRTRFLSQDEEAKLLEALGPTYAPYARLAILTGLRQEEQFSLQWAQIDFELSVITLPVTKAGEVQYLPLNEAAKTILRSLESWQQSKWVFPSKDQGKKKKHPSTHLDAKNFYRRVYVPALIKAGLRKPKGQEPDPPGQKVDWHTLRHTFASRLAMQSVPLVTIAALLRHSTTSLVKRYAHLSPTYLHGAIEEISRFNQG